jgi:predicted dehydrogenase
VSSNQSTRREFLRDGFIAAEAAAALALFAGRQEASAAEPRLATTKRADGSAYKIGILGCGNRSRFHVNALNDVAEIDVAALCDVLPHKMDQRAKQIKKKSADVRKYTDMEQMFAQPDLDAIAVVLPNHLHKAAVVAALQAGKNVFCEKPMALTVADCNEMIAAAERARKAIQVGTQRRHGKGYKMAVEAIRGAPVGKILSSAVNSYRGDWREPAADEYPPGVQYWRLNQAQAGGVVYEMGAHTIDVNNWIFDSEPVTVASLQGVNDAALRKRDSMDHGAVLVRYANDALMNYGGNLYTHGPAADDYFFATNGTIALGDRTLAIKYGHPSGLPSKDPLPAALSLDLPGGDGTNEQWKYFAKVLAGEAEPYPNGHHARQSIQICQGAMIAARDRTVVNVKDLG